LACASPASRITQPTPNCPQNAANASARLRELEDDAPKWLTDAIGPRPGRSKSASGVVLAWRRAALAIDDYHALQQGRAQVRPEGAEVEALQCHERAQRAVEHLRAERQRRHGHDRGREL
jgi:hypothetical protein